MKTRLLVSLFLLIPVLAFIVYKPAEKLNVNSISGESSTSDTSGGDGRFLIGAVHSSKDDSSNYVHYDSLGFNMWHTYTYTYLDPITNLYSPATTMDTNDNLLTPVSNYAGDVQTKINSIYSHNQSRLILMRPKIEWLCYGQRSDYQCEDSHRDTALWFYSFQRAGHNGGVDSQDFNYADGNWVRYFRSQNSTNSGSWVDNPGIVISKLKANTEQCRTGTGKTGNLWQTDEQFDWYIKPRIRIDTTYANNPVNWNDPICKIIIINENASDTLKEIEIKTINFRNNSNYNGSYIEEYFNLQDSLKLHGAWGNKAYWEARGNRAPQSEDNKVDIQVYWYGNCDMWIDYIRVDNQIANDLLSNDLNNPQFLRYKGWLDSEVTQIGLHTITGASTPAAYKFYIELTEFNNFPCMAYVNKKIKQYSSDKLGLISDWTFRNSMHVPWENRSTVMTTDFIKRFYIDSIGFNAFFAECYPYNSDTDPATSNSPAKIPNTLHVTSCGSGPCGIMAYPIPPNQFDDWLQDNMDHEPFYFSSNAIWDSTKKESLWMRGLSKFILDLGDQISKSYNIPFILMPQSHSWYNPNVEIHNEPTNEELDLQANLAVSYGVRGLMYFAWNSQNQPGQNEYARALTEIGGTLRQKNVYGQDKTKKQTMIDLIKRMKNWEPYVMSFDNDNRKSYILRLERDNLINETFFTDILSYKPDPSDYSSPLTTSESVSQRYLQVAVFNNPNEQYNKYFMIVNRRCSPFINDSTNDDNNGGRRFVKIKLYSNSDQFAGFNNWKIIDLENNSTVLTFDKRITSLLNLNWFLPGEGKLYKLAPVMQEGGTLVANEEVSNIQFVCKSTVMNNGKNISIGSGTEIFFKEGAGINMTGGNFICDGSQGNDNILLKGKNAEHWNGINLINTGSLTKIEKTTFENTKSPVVIDNSQFGAQYSVKVIRRNIFNITQDSGVALRIRNQFAMLIDSNTFDVSNFNSTSAIYYSNYSDPGPAGATPEDNYFVNITNNIFSGAYFPVMINDLGTAYSSFYMYNNQFQNTALFGITGMKITGTIKNNRFINSTKNYCIYLSLSNPDIYGNYFNSDKRNMVLTASYPGIAPIRNNNNQLIWKGGRNGFNVNQGNDTSNNIGQENINLKSSLPITDLGENSFSIPNSNCFHISGSVQIGDSETYLTRKNCWTDLDAPRIILYNAVDTHSIGYEYTPSLCIPSDNISNEITEIGFGMNDTTYISEYDSTNVLPQDEALYSEARELLSNGNHSEAITNFKALINEFHTSDYIYSSQDYLYESYRGLDTSENQEVTDILFSDLKQYLETKISIGHYDEDFDDNAYEIILMCEQKLENYNNALSGYEFISLYHPDAYRRIQASWEYDNIESILGGMGGGERDLEFGNSNLEFDINKRLKRINEFADNDPATGKIRQNYLKANAEKKANEEKKANPDFKESKTTNILNNGRSNENDDKLIERAKQNLFLSKRTSKEEKERRRFEDLKLILNPDNLQAGQKETDNLIPVQYSLSQNYPNPFNPNTKFKFSLPADSRVNITVYDLLGREVEKLINNDFRKAGVYTVEFAAKNLSSGVYFYRLETENFIQTKRMILLK